MPVVAPVISTVLMVGLYTPCILILKRNLTDATHPGYTRSTVLKKGALLRFQEAARSALDVRLSEGGILNAAVEIFAERGFATTRVEDILERAGVARRTFYKYFSSKEAVLAAIYELATGELIAGMQAASAGAEADPLEAIQLGLEYNPAPPFASGHPDVADPEIVAAVRERLVSRGRDRFAKRR